MGPHHHLCVLFALLGPLLGGLKGLPLEESSHGLWVGEKEKLAVSVLWDVVPFFVEKGVVLLLSGQ